MLDSAVLAVHGVAFCAERVRQEVDRRARVVVDERWGRPSGCFIGVSFSPGFRTAYERPASPVLNEIDLRGDRAGRCDCRLGTASDSSPQARGTRGSGAPGRRSRRRTRSRRGRDPACGRAVAARCEANHARDCLRREADLLAEASRSGGGGSSRAPIASAPIGRATLRGVEVVPRPRDSGVGRPSNR